MHKLTCRASIVGSASGIGPRDQTTSDGSGTGVLDEGCSGTGGFSVVGGFKGGGESSEPAASIARRSRFFFARGFRIKAAITMTPSKTFHVGNVSGSGRLSTPHGRAHDDCKVSKGRHHVEFRLEGQAQDGEQPSTHINGEEKH